MAAVSRRTFMAGGRRGGRAASLLANLPQAEASGPRRSQPRRRRDVVILMAGERSFDHYYGTMRGCGLATEPRCETWSASRTCSASTVGTCCRSGWTRPRSTARTSATYCTTGTPPTWPGTAALQPVDPGQVRDDHVVLRHRRHPVPRALASAFTICDHYFCSIQGRPPRTGSTTGPAPSTRTVPPAARRPPTRPTTSRCTAGLPIRNGCRRPASRGRCTPTTRSATGSSAITATTVVAVPRLPRRAGLGRPREEAAGRAGLAAHRVEARLGAGPERRPRDRAVRGRLRGRHPAAVSWWWRRTGTASIRRRDRSTARRTCRAC